MKFSVCLLVGMDSHSCAIAHRVARASFPEAMIMALDHLTEAIERKAGLGGELLVLANPDEGEIAKATEALDPTGLRRWGIVVLGSTPPVEGVEIVSGEEWKDKQLGRIFRAAAAQHHLVRMNEKLRGDLRTIAHRIIHDLRAPLSGILCAGEVLREALAEHDASSAALAKPLFDSVEDLKAIIDHLSLLSKATSHPVVNETVAMEEVVWMVLQQLERLHFQPGSVSVQPLPWPQVEGVSSWLETVWRLLFQALREGKVSPRIELGWSREKGVYRFWVRDGNERFPQPNPRAFFRPFHLLHQTDVKPDLGLSIAQRLVELQGGQCGYGPHSAGGAGFYFTLPHLAKTHLADLKPHP